ncbi:ATP-binding protein [Sphingobium sp. HWE2-09]|uniref:ATP-binding protein n=1 Tax=Sphingobium sp. HWE2-09 TaxID=3108390 RepID=UPI002DC0ACFB|nr:ATP-binding protein [Sphingobium sp. HWE2-09]
MNGTPPRPPRPLRFLLSALLVPLVLAALLFWLGGEYDRWNSLREDADRSFQRRVLLINILSEMRAAELSQRGYVITNDPEFRARYNEWHARIDQSFARADQLYRNVPSHQIGFSSLRRIADIKIAEMDAVLRRYDERGPDAARLRVADGEGKRLMSRLQLQLDQVIRDEQRIGENRVAAYRSRTEALQRVMWILIALSSLSLAIALLGLWRQRVAQYQTEMRGFEAAQRNETILDSTIDPIIIVNPSGSIETINQAATKMLGYEATSLARRDFDLISDIAPGVGSFLDRVGLVDGKLKTPYWTDRQVRHQSGRLLPVDIALGVMALPDGDHIVVSLRDIVERKRVERLKDDLISTVSHELRTPLTSIVGALGLLRLDVGNRLDPELTGLVTIAENNAQRLIRLINDMLDIDRIDSGKLRMTLAPIDLHHVILRACGDNSGLVRTTGTLLDCATTGETLMIQGDEERLLQVITNLLSNAVKASAKGGHVTVGLTRSADGRRATVYVDDEGPGIPQEFRGRIFGRFERATNDEGAPGTGLGLAIAREIVSQHGGDLWFEDRVGGGTRFAFSLPVMLPIAIPRAEPDGASILICESNPAAARLLQSQLSEEGYACRVVTSAHAAREAIAANGYSLLLLDMALDDADAFHFAREVRRLEGPETLSILMVSAQGGDASTPLSLNLVDWIDKPIDPGRLKSAIATSFRRSGTDRPTVLQLDDDQDTLEITASALKGIAYILKATTLEEARALIRVETPHLAILDVHLEEGLGLDLLPDLVDDQGIAIPTIIYSAHDVDIEIAGQINAVLVKSRTSLPDLKATVRRVVAARQNAPKEGDEA